MYEIKKIAIFCGANPGRNSDYADAAGRLASYLGEQKIGVVFGGTNVGLMGIIANEAMAAGGEVIGVIPDHLEERGIAHPDLTELHIVKDLHERKAKMASLADAFIALPGGIGTLEELFEVWTWSKMGIHRKPCGFLNVKNYYNQLQSFVDHMVTEGFLGGNHYSDILRFEEDPEKLMSFFRNYIPPLEMWADTKTNDGTKIG